jgi:hypothetical protein
VIEFSADIIDVEAGKIAADKVRSNGRSCVLSAFTIDCRAQRNCLDGRKPMRHSTA